MINEILDHAPGFVKRRFYNFRAYAYGKLFVKDEYVQVVERLSRTRRKSESKKVIQDLVDEAAVMLLILHLKLYLDDGTKQAIVAVDTLKEIGVDGFTVGTTEFVSRNENVMLGGELSKKLIDCLPSDIRRFIESQSNYYGIINEYKKKIKLL